MQGGARRGYARRRMSVHFAALGAAMLVYGGAIAQAQAPAPYPQRNVLMIVPYSPGTGADIAARALGPRLAILTHLDHDLDYQDLSARLPDGVLAGFDGLAVSVEAR